jgi:hypothetical protein
LASLIPDQEEILSYMGLSAELINNEIEKMRRFEDMNV